ncbi:MAG: hypothetical protein HYV40_05755 [Candidatus Levybacteria bacterium]|nr:hypothetical protein [Candidatus Levybacteria bacterium]
MSLETGAVYTDNIRRDGNTRIWSRARHGGPIVWEFPNGAMSYRIQIGEKWFVKYVPPPDTSQNVAPSPLAEPVFQEVTESGQLPLPTQLDKTVQPKP